MTDLAAAKGFRDDARTAARKGALRAPAPTTVRKAGEAWLAGARDGSIRTRSGDQFKPSTIRGYEEALRLRLYPELGPMRLVDLRRSDLQHMADRLLAEKCDASTIRNTFKPLQAICRRAITRDELALKPTVGLELPAPRGTRDRFASATEGELLLAAVPAGDRALWATALYAGLRRGELQALRWDDVDLAGGVIRVERSWDQREGVIDPKSRAGHRKVPIPPALRDFLVEHRMSGPQTTGLVFGRDPERPFDPSTVMARARRAWTVAGLRPIGLHECRHTFASLMIAAGASAKAISSYLGHASVTITYDRYGHLMPGKRGRSGGAARRLPRARARERRPPGDARLTPRSRARRAGLGARGGE